MGLSASLSLMMTGFIVTCEAYHVLLHALNSKIRWVNSHMSLEAKSM